MYENRMREVLESSPLADEGTEPGVVSDLSRAPRLVARWELRLRAPTSISRTSTIDKAQLINRCTMLDRVVS